jgi:tetratricopeptide (TPR) repeat protein
MKEPNLAKILRWLIYATALVPLIIFSQFISPFHFGKVIVFRSLVELMVALYLVLIIQDRRYYPKTNNILGAFLFFTAAFTLTTITSAQPYDSFWGTLERMGGLWTFWHYFVFYLILTSILTKKEHWLNLLNLTILVGVLSAFYGFLQKTDVSWVMGAGGRERIFGTIGNAALFAGYQLLVLFLAATLFLNTNKFEKIRIFYLFSFFIMIIAVLMTAVRGSILALGVGSILLVFLYFKNFGSVIAKKIMIGLVLLVVIFLFFTFAFKNSDLVQNSGYLKRITDFSLKTYTVQTRIWAWKAGLSGWLETPKTILLGWGPENFNIPFSKHFNPKFFRGPGSETLFDRGHNMFIEVLVTMGVFGLLAYLSIFFVLFKKLFKYLKTEENKKYSVGLITLLVAYVIHNSFIFDTSANFLTFFIIMGFINFLDKNQDDNKEQKKFLTKKPNFFVLVVLIILAIILINKTNIVDVKANYAFTRGIIAGLAGDFDRAVSKFKEAISYNTPGNYEYRHKFAQYMIDYSSSQKVDDKIKEELLFAIKEVEKNKIGRNNDYLPRLYIGRMNLILGRDDPSSPYNDQALKEDLEAIKISPTFIRTYYEIAQVYLNKKDYTSAAEWFSKAVQLNPDVAISYWYQGVVELELGNQEKGIELINTAFEKGYKADKDDYLRLVPLFVKIQDYKRVVDIYENLTRLEPNNPQFFASLAIAYSKIGKIDEAVMAARQAVKIDPNFEPEARIFLRKLGREL